jgi:hypothetical protein
MRASISVIAFLVGLVAGAWLLRVEVIAARGPEADALDHLGVYGDDYDVIVVGSSLSEVNFLPGELDQRTAELGHPLRSFALGMKGMRGAELHYYVQRVLEFPLRRLQWLIVDVSLQQDLLEDPEAGYVQRAIDWHAPAQALLAMRQVLASDEPLARKLSMLGSHARYLLLNRGNVGAGIAALQSGAWLEPPPKVKTRGSLVAGHFLARGDQAKAARYRRRHAWHEAQRRSLKYSRRVKRELRPNMIQRAIAKLARDRGKHVAFLLSPVLYDARFAPSAAGGEPLHVIDLDDPARYPELYDPGLRYDDLHLTYAGSIPYTRAIADQLVELMSTRESQAPR